jgi:mono/diheme cytochrome c family protein
MTGLQRIGVGVGALVAFGAVGIVGFVGYGAFAAKGKLQYPDAPYPEGIVASTDPNVIERGRYLVHGPAHCAQCHSSTDRDHPELIATAPLSGGLAFEMGPMASMWSANLTPDVATGIGRRTDAELARTILTGVLPDGSFSIFMGTSASKPAKEDVTAIISYLRSIPPIEHEVKPGEWYLFGKLLVTYAFPRFTLKSTAGPAYVPVAEAPSVARGEYLAENVMLCVACHSPFDMATFESLPPKAGGGQAEQSHGKDSDKEYAPPNLTSDPTGITGKWTEDQFVTRLQGGRVYASSIMPWENFAATSDSDLRSVYRYLKSLPPVKNDTGPSYRDVGWTPTP